LFHNTDFLTIKGVMAGDGRKEWGCRNSWSSVAAFVTFVVCCPSEIKKVNFGQGNQSSHKSIRIICLGAAQ
jgi:hypothetical protein